MSLLSIFINLLHHSGMSGHHFTWSIGREKHIGGVVFSNLNGLLIHPKLTSNYEDGAN